MAALIKLYLLCRFENEDIRPPVAGYVCSFAILIVRLTNKFSQNSTRFVQPKNFNTTYVCTDMKANVNGNITEGHSATEPVCKMAKYKRI
jgi:hypothetical protein